MYKAFLTNPNVPLSLPLFENSNKPAKLVSMVARPMLGIIKSVNEMRRDTASAYQRLDIQHRVIRDSVKV